jgi:N-acyl-D-aspartate/D-glutamate deacylase
MAADVVIFDPATVKCGKEEVVHDFPAGGWRFKEPAQGIYATFVNGKMLMKEGSHTGNLPGRVLRNSRYQASHA